MKKKFKLAAGMLMIAFCMLPGCEKKEKQQSELLLIPVEEAANQNIPREKEKEDEEPGSVENCVVHICGAVNSPGVYTLEANSRIYQAVERAGGFREDADPDYLNQAGLIMDGMKIYIPTESEVENADGINSWWETEDGGMAKKSSLVNINTAGEDLLCSLPGIGSSKAKSIIAYREKNGAFQKIEDIMNVEGIKDGLFQKIKDSITV